MKTLIVNHNANALCCIRAGFRPSSMLWTRDSNPVYDLGAGVVSSALCSINSLFRYPREHLFRVFSRVSPDGMRPGGETGCILDVPVAPAGPGAIAFHQN